MCSTSVSKKNKTKNKLFKSSYYGESKYPNFKNLKFKDTINPLELFVEKRQFFNQNNKWLNSIIYR